MRVLSFSKFLLSPARLAKIGLIVAFLMTASGAISQSAAAQTGQLVMFYSVGCVWCKAWDDNVGVIYGKTDEAKILPLRRVDFGAKKIPSDLSYIKGVAYTPTFVILDGGKEVGRIIGYPGESFFWQMLGGYVKKIEKKRAAN